MAAELPFVDAILNQFVDRLRWGSGSVGDSVGDGGFGRLTTITRDRDSAIEASALPLIDVRCGSDTPVQGKLGVLTSELQVFVDLYVSLGESADISFKLLDMRARTQRLLLRPSFRGETQTAAVSDLNMSPYVISVRLVGVDAVDVIPLAERGVGHMRTTYAVRYAISPLGYAIPLVVPNGYSLNVVDDNTNDVGWEIFTPSSNGLNQDVTTFVIAVVPETAPSIFVHEVRNGRPDGGAPALYWHGFQARANEYVSGLLTELDPGTYRFYSTQIVAGLVDQRGPAVTTITKTE